MTGKFFRTKNIHVAYDKVPALVDISLEVDRGSVVALIGANGAGKTTLLRTISGLKRIENGEIWFEEERLDSMAPPEIVKRGIIQVAEDKKLFPYMSVMDNLKMGSYLRDSSDRQDAFQTVHSSFPILKERAGQLAGTLSGGEQQMLAIGRALMAGPKLLLLDEPTLGLSPIMSIEIAKIVTGIHKLGISIILVEQNARLALSLAQKGYVLETGKIVLEDTAERLLNNESVKVAYLGG